MEAMRNSVLNLPLKFQRIAGKFGNASVGGRSIRRAFHLAVFDAPYRLAEVMVKQGRRLKKEAAGAW